MLHFIPLKAQNNLWYFGNGCGMLFTQGGIKTGITHKLFIDEANVTVSDSVDSLLFYSNGTAIYNHKDAVMDLGWALHGNTSTTQGITYLKLDSGYYMFFVMDIAGLRYSWGLLNIYMNNGDGLIIKKNQYLIDSMCEKQALISYNNKSYLVTSDYKREFFYLFEIDKENRLVSFYKKISMEVSKANTTTGYLKLSPNGKILAYVYDKYHQGEVLLYCVNYNPDLDIRYFGSISNFDYTASWVYSCEFSPDCSKLYASNAERIYQYDLRSKNIDSINKSKKTLFGPLNTAISSFAGMQLGPDKKIYISEESKNFLAVINNPNFKEDSCNFTYRAISISNCNCYANFPYFETQYLNEDSNYKMDLGCIETPVSNGSYFLVPNAFTPNGDGINELLKYDYDSVTDFSISIYNRWGEQVFHTTTPDNFWNGKFKDLYCPTGVYMCIVTYVDTKGEKQYKIQTISLLR